MDYKELAKKQFGAHAEQYVVSPRHAKGPDLQKLVLAAEADGSERLLDVATGGGHVVQALSPLVREAVAYDLTPEILEAAGRFLADNGRTNVTFVQGDAEHMPFPDQSFNLVTCRIAAHHFPQPDAFVAESFRVLAPGGKLLLIDNVSPQERDADLFYNDVERRRDPSHFRAWTKAEWVARLENAGFRVTELESFGKPFPFRDWCDRMGVTEEDRLQLEERILTAPEEIRTRIGVAEEQGALISFQGESVLFVARKG